MLFSPKAKGRKLPAESHRLGPTHTCIENKGDKERFFVEVVEGFLKISLSNRRAFNDGNCRTFSVTLKFILRSMIQTYIPRAYWSHIGEIFFEKLLNIHNHMVSCHKQE